MFRSVASRATLFGALGLVLLASCESQDAAHDARAADAGAVDAAAGFNADSDDGNPSKQPTQTATDGGGRDGLRFDGGVTTDGAPSLISVERACAMKAQSLCARLLACAPFATALRYGDRARCVARVEAACVEEGRGADTGVNETNLVACARQLDLASCDDLASRNVAALSWCLVPGRRELGKSCAAGSQCSSGYCRIEGACGTCRARADEGQPCTSDDGCAAGRVCSAAGVCVSPGSKGASCDARTTPCLPSLSCVERRCVTPTNAGAKCSDDAECDARRGATCQSGSYDGKVCVERKVGLPGEPCGAATPGSPTTCLGGDALCVGEGAAARCVAPADPAPATCK